MKLLLAPDSFKGSLSSTEIIECLEKVAKEHFKPLKIVKVPIADGGEGTVDALTLMKNGEFHHVEVTGPLNAKVKAKYGIIDGKTAVLEMAQASGLPLLKLHEMNPLLTSTYGTGELIKAVLDKGIRDIIIGIGGSATNDGGIGALQALGVKLTDHNNMPLGRGGIELENVHNIDIKTIDPRIKESTITVICDVSNPLTGKNGSTAVFGPQKGATDETIEILEKGMQNYANVIKKQFGVIPNEIPGSGAAGGLGAALVCFLGAKLKSGIDTILDFVGFDDLLEGVDLVVTGEGRIDGQSIYGKVPIGIARRCKAKNIKVVAIVGSIGKDAQLVYDYGISSIMPIVNRDMSLEEAMGNATNLLTDAADRMFRFIKVFN